MKIQFLDLLSFLPQWIHRFTIVALFLITPLLFTTNFDFSPSENPKIFYALFLLSGSISIQILLNFKNKIQIRVGYWQTFIILFLVSMMISAALSPSFLVSFFGFQEIPSLSILSHLVAFAIALYVFQSSDPFDIELIKFSLILSASACSMYGIAQSFGIDPIFVNFKEALQVRAFGTMGNPIPYGIFCGIGGLLSFFFVEKYRRSYLILPFIFSFAICSYGVITSGSRTPVFTYFVISTLMIVRSISKLNFNHNYILKKVYFVPCFLLIAGLFAITGTQNVQKLIQKFNPSLLGLSVQSRMAVNQIGWQAGQENVFFGAGPSFFGHVYYKHKPIWHNNLYAWNENMIVAHNHLTEIWVTQGSIGLIIYIGIFVFFILNSIRLLKTDVDFEIRRTTETIIFLVLFIWLNGLTMYSYFFELVLIYTFQGLVARFRSSSIDLKPGTKSTALKVLVLIFFISNLPLSYNHWKANQYFYIAKRLNEKGLIIESLEMTTKATELAPLNFSFDCLYTEVLIRGAIATPKFNLSNRFLEMLETSKVNCMKHAIYNYVIPMRLVYYFVVGSKIRSSWENIGIEIYKNTLNQHPASTHLHLNLAKAYIAIDRPSDAIPLLKIVISLRKDFIEPRYWLISSLLKINLTQEAIDQVNEIIELNLDTKSEFFEKEFYESIHEELLKNNLQQEADRLKNNSK